MYYSYNFYAQKAIDLYPQKYKKNYLTNGTESLHVYLYSSPLGVFDILVL